METGLEPWYVCKRCWVAALCCGMDAAVGAFLSLSGAVSNLAKVGEKVVGLGDCDFVRIPWSNEPLCCGGVFCGAGDGATGWSVTSG